MISLHSQKGEVEVKALGAVEEIAADACIAITALCKSIWDSGNGDEFELCLLAGLPYAIYIAKEKFEEEKGKEVK